MLLAAAALNWQEWFTLAVLAAVIAGLVLHAAAADVVLMGALGLLMIAGVVSPKEGLAGFQNEGVLTVGALFVVAAGLVQTGFLTGISNHLLGRTERVRTALVRFMPPVVASSAFLNNTTVVAMAMPALLDWTRKRRIPASAVLLPLSYGAILGGVCTLIGTSTNLVVHGLMKASGIADLKGGFGMWELAPVGVPIAVAGTLYLILFGARLLPERKEFLEQLDESRREYLTELIVERGCPLIGQTVQQAGLRHLPGLFLIEIDRDDQFISPVEPDERLRVGDRLVFTGIVSTIVDLQKIPHLVPAAEPQYQIDPATRRGRRLCEAVISVSSPLVGMGVREANFRGRFNAAVVAVHRGGRRLTQKIGDIRLQPGDTLLLETGAGFVLAQRNNPGFYLVSEVGDTVDVRHEKAWLAAFITAALIVSLTLPDVLAWFPSMRGLAGWFESQRVTFAMLAAGLMVVTRCVSIGDARRSIEWSVLLMIAASFGVGAALKNSGAAARIGEATIMLFHNWGPVGVLAGTYIVTWVLTELMSNNAAAALMFPVAMATAHQLGADPRAYAVAITIAASGGFLFPAGYQTHLMVFGPGGYKVGDFLKVGAPMVVLWFAIAMLVIPRVWPLVPPG